MNERIQSDEARVTLALRARARREQLGLTRAEVGQKADISPVTLGNWEKKLPKYIDFDSAWEEALGAPKGWLRGEAAAEFEMTVLLDLTDAERIELAHRARVQRELRGLTKAELAQMLAVSAPTLQSWEGKLPKSTAHDARWEQAIKVPEGWLRSKDIAAIEYKNEFAPSSKVRDLCDAMRELFAWYAVDNKAKRTSDLRGLTNNQVRAVEIMLHRYGAYGQETSTLQAIGEIYGLTRERVRKISEKVVENIRSEKVSLPILVQIRQTAHSMLPSPVSTLTEKMSTLLGDRLSIEDADRFSRDIFGERIIKVESKVGVYASLTEKVAVDPATDDAMVRVIRQTAMSMIRATGAAQIFFVAGAVSQEMGRGIMPADVVQACLTWDSFQWLAEKDGWFWFGPAYENRAITCASKILAIANRNVDIEEVQSAMSRMKFRHETEKARPFMINAPTSVLKDVLSKVKHIDLVHYNDFRLHSGRMETTLHEDAQLSETDLTVLKVMQEYGGIASRKMLYAELVEKGGMVPATFNTFLDTSPLMHRIDNGIWSLAGTKLDPSAILNAHVADSEKKGINVLAPERDR